MTCPNELARRAVACARWRWVPGMLTQHGRICGAGYLVSDDVDEGGQPFVDCTDTTDDWPGLLPDLTDPATLGALLALVRDLWGDPYLYIFWHRWGDVESWMIQASRKVGSEYDTEAEALVVALEAAP